MKRTIIAIALIATLIAVLGGANSAKAWVVMPIEDTYLFMQDDDSLSPQLYPDEHQVRHVEADYIEVPLTGVRSNRDWVEVGHWTHEMDAPITATDSEAYLEFWWCEVDEGYDNDPEFRIWIKVGAWEDTWTISMGAGTVTEPERMEIAMDMQTQDIAEGDSIEVSIEYQGWEDMELHYMCYEYPTGLMLQTDAMRFYKMEATKTSVTLLVGDHFYIDWSLQPELICSCAIINRGAFSELFDEDNYFFTVSIQFNISSEYGIDLNFSGMLMTWDVEFGDGEKMAYVLTHYNNLSFPHWGYKNFTFGEDDDSGLLESLIIPIGGVGIIAVAASFVYFKRYKKGVEEVP